jgi:phage tail tape-measure protein
MDVLTHFRDQDRAGITAAAGASRRRFILTVASGGFAACVASLDALSRGPGQRAALRVVVSDRTEVTAVTCPS